jgi:hypothetical protein
LFVDVCLGLLKRPTLHALLSVACQDSRKGQKNSETLQSYTTPTSARAL